MSDARDEFYIKSMTQRTKDLDDAYARIRDLEARNAELTGSGALTNEVTLLREMNAELQARNAGLERNLSSVHQLLNERTQRMDEAENALRTLRRLDKEADARVKVLEEALRDIITNERGGSIETITSQIASEALQAVAREEGDT